jgi:hypothetical protein
MSNPHHQAPLRTVQAAGRRLFRSDARGLGAALRCRAQYFAPRRPQEMTSGLIHPGSVAHRPGNQAGPMGDDSSSIYYCRRRFQSMAPNSTAPTPRKAGKPTPIEGAGAPRRHDAVDGQAADTAVAD